MAGRRTSLGSRRERAGGDRRRHPGGGSSSQGGSGERRHLQRLDDRETWATHLWLSNDAGLYSWAVETVAHGGADALKEGLEDLQAALIDSPDGQYAYAECGLVLRVRDAALALGDIGSLWRVDWNEVAEAFRE